jgi:hypothetical protein
MTTTMATTGGTTTIITGIITTIVIMAGSLSSSDAAACCVWKGGLGRPFAFSVGHSQEPTAPPKKIKKASNLFRCRNDR